MQMRRIAMILGPVALALACGGGDTGDPIFAASDSGDTTAPAADAAADAVSDVGSDSTAPTAAPTCVWNQAYQENSEPDSVEGILAGASGCYVLIDAFDSEQARDAIPALHAAENVVGCYVSVGTCENWRDDFEALRPACTTREWPEWEGEFFVSDAERALPHMQARVAQLAGWGCDYVEFDNMDWALYEDAREEYGLELTRDEAIAYADSLCSTVHEAGMRCMAKNMRDAAGAFDGGTFESSADDRDWWDAAHLRGFLAAGQLGIVVHYGERDCASAEAFYRERYGDGVSFLCENARSGGYAH